MNDLINERMKRDFQDMLGWQSLREVEDFLKELGDRGYKLIPPYTEKAKGLTP